MEECFVCCSSLIDGLIEKIRYGKRSTCVEISLLKDTISC